MCSTIGGAGSAARPADQRGITDLSPRLLVDVSSVVRWSGAPVGIFRVEHELAMHAATRSDTLLCLWDRTIGGFRALNAAWASLVTGWYGTIDMSGVDF